MPRYQFGSWEHEAYTILVVGAAACGKTSLIRRFIEDTFSEQYTPTECNNTIFHTVKIDGGDVRIQLSDTDGYGRYQFASLNPYQYNMAVIVIYDISDQSSMESIKDICSKIKAYCEDPCTILVGNKSDKKREINLSDAEAFAEKENMPHIETSAKENTNVHEMFMSLIKRLNEKYPACASNTEEEEDEKEEEKLDVKTTTVVTTKNSGCSCIIS